MEEKMEINTENTPDDILTHLEKDVNPEQEMAAEAPISAEETEEKKTTAEEVRSARRENRRRQAAVNEEREQRIAQEQVELTTESSLRSAIRNGTQFTGTAAGVETVEGEDGEQEVALVALLKLNFKVVIPFAELFTYNPIDMSTVDLSTEEGKRDYIRRKRVFAEKMIGSTISFCLLNIYPEGNMTTALGSRAAAMRRISQRMFGGTSPRWKEGDVGTAIITAVARHAVAVEFNGVDVVIPQYRLTLRWMRYVHEFYKIGDPISVKIRDIHKDDKGRIESLVLDHIACELADSRDRYALLKDGARLRGIVTNVYRPVGSRGIYIYAWLPEWEIPARISRIDANDFGREIKAGTQMRLEVISHDENGYVTCVALSEHGNSSMFTQFRTYNSR